MSMTSVVPSDGATARRRRPHLSIGILAVALMAGTLAPVSIANADTKPADPAAPSTPTTVTSDPLPAPQLGRGTKRPDADADRFNTETGGSAADQVVIGDVVYVGGVFQHARPAGAGVDEGTQVRKNLLAYDLHSGRLLDFAPSFGGPINALAASPDGTRLYVAGKFEWASSSGTSVEIKRRNIAAIDVATGRVVSDFAPGLNAQAYDIDATDSSVYVAGAFGSVTGGERSRFAAFSAATGLLLQWQPKALVDMDPRVPTAADQVTKTRGRTLLVSPDGSKVVIAGVFVAVADEQGKPVPSTRGMAAVDAVTGLPVTWKVSETIRNGDDYTSILDLVSHGDSVYGVGFQNGMAQDELLGKAVADHEFEGTFKASWADGALEWMTDCHGDSYSVAVLGEAVYNVSHAHNCTGVGGFDDIGDKTSPYKYNRALAFSAERTGTLAPFTKIPGYFNYGGQPAPSLLDWYPQLDAGVFTGQNQAAWDVTTADGYVLLAGEFLRVNGQPFGGLVRFAVTEKVEDADGPTHAGDAMKPTVSVTDGPPVELSWTANVDRDNARLTYEVIRDGNLDRPVATVTATSRFWDRPTLTAIDGGLVPGRTYTYQIKTTDPLRNSTMGSPVTIMATAASAATVSAYDRRILQDAPVAYWPFNEPTGSATVASDWAAANGMFHAPAARGAGAEKTLPGRSATFVETQKQWAATQRITAPLAQHSQELWFSTRTKTGGSLMSFGRSNTGHDTYYGRSLYMNTDGTIAYTPYLSAGTSTTLTSQKAGYNDGAWHHVVATTGPNGSFLYVDGRLVRRGSTIVSAQKFPGAWNVGGYDVTQFPGVRTSRYFTGAIDNAAVYSRVLPASEVLAHYTVGVTR